MPSYHKKNIQTFLNSLGQEELSQIQSIKANLSAENNTEDEIFLYEANPVEIIDYKIPQLSSFYKKQFDQIDKEYVKCIEIKNKLCCYNPVFKSQHTKKVIVKRKKRIANKKYTSQKYLGQCFNFQKSLKTQIGVDLFNTGVEFLDKCFPNKKTVLVPTFYHKHNPLNKEWDNPKFELLIDVKDQDDNQFLSKQKVEFQGASQFNQDTDLEGKIGILIDDKNIIQLSKSKELTIKADLIYKESKTTIPVNMIDKLVENGSYQITIYREKKFKQSLTITLPCIETLKKQNYSLYFSLGQETEERQVKFDENTITAFYAFENKANKLKIILKESSPSNKERILYDGAFQADVDQNLLGISCLHLEKQIINNKEEFLSKGKDFEFAIQKKNQSTGTELNSTNLKVGPQGDVDFLFFNIEREESFTLSEKIYSNFFPTPPSEIEISRGEKKEIVVQNKIRCDNLPTEKKTKVESSRTIELNPDPKGPGFSIYSLEAHLMKFIINPNRGQKDYFELDKVLTNKKLKYNEHYTYDDKAMKIRINNLNIKEISPFFMISKCFTVDQEGTILFKKITAISDNEGEIFLNNQRIGDIANYNEKKTTIKNITIPSGENCLYFKWYNRYKDDEDNYMVTGKKKENVFYYEPINQADISRGVRGVTPYSRNESFISFDIELEFKSSKYEMQPMNSKEIQKNKNDCYERIKDFYTTQE